MQSLIAYDSSGLLGEGMFTGRDIELAQQGVPVELQPAPRLAPLDYQIEALHRHD